jgi:L-malate glycosyltransferase
MKICYIAFGGEHAKKMCRFFAEKGHDVHLLTWGFTGGDTEKIWNPSEWKGVNVHYMGGKNPKINKWLIPITAFSIRKKIRQIKPDLVHSLYLLPYSVYGMLSGFHPHIAAAWGNDVLIDPQRNPIYRIIVSTILKRADLVTSVSNQISKACITYGADKNRMFLVRIGVDTTLVSQKYLALTIRQTLGWHNNIVLVSTRLLEPIYNTRAIINALPSVIQKIPNIRLLIIGSGSQKENLEGMVQQLNLKEYVHFTGRLSGEDYMANVRSGDIYISASLSDGCSVSLLEAMMLRIYPVVSDIPANQEFVSDGVNGLLFPPENPELLAERIITASKKFRLDNTILHYNAKLVADKASLNSTMEQLEQIYLSVSNKREIKNEIKG